MTTTTATTTTTTTTTTMTSSSSSTTTIHLHVEGMMCQRNCGTTVRCALEQMLLSSSSSTSMSEQPKVTFAEAVFAEQRAAVTIQHGDSENPSSAIMIKQWTEAAVDAVECVGFDAEPIDDLEDYLAEFRKQREAEEKAAVAEQPPPPPPPPPIVDAPDTVTLQVSGMSCAVCTGRVERSLLRLPFARSASVDLATSRAVVHCDNNISMEEISLDESSSGRNNVLDEDDEARVARRRSSCQQAVTAAGYECKVLTAESNSVQAMQEAQKEEVRAWRNLLLYSLFFTVPLVVLDHVDVSGGGFWSEHVQKGHEHLHYEHHQHHDPTMMNSNNEFDGNGMPSSMMPSMMTMGNGNDGGGSNASVMDDGGTNLNIGKQWILLLLAAAVQFGPSGRRFYKAAYKGWVHGPAVMGMDFLVVLGTTASFVYSVVVLFMLQWGPMVGGTGGAGETENGEGNLAMAAGGMHGGSGKGDEHLMPTFATGAMLLTFVTFGKFLEAYAKGKTASALQTLMELQPLQASKIVFDSSEPPPQPEMWDNAFIAAVRTEDVSVENIRVGDYLRVLPGARIPADGVVIAVSSSSNNNSNDDAKGNSNGVNMAYVDESAFTGEPFPVAKAPGKQVFASTVNQLSVLVVQVQATGNATALSQIVTLVQNAQASKAPIQDYADSVAGIFAPTVIGLAMITFAAWMALNAASNERFFVAFTTAIAVIVVACPCTLGLATPTAVMVGTGVGATHGLLIKGGAALEKLHAVDTVVFDKTGTLTTGKAVLGRRISYVNNNGNDQKKNDRMNTVDDPLLQGLPSKVNAGNVALWLAACAETTSEHPLGKAVVNAAKSEFGSYDVTGANEGVAVENFAVVPGRGVECTVSNNTNANNNNNNEWGTWNVRVGNRAWTKETPPNNGLEDGKGAETEEDDDDATGDADVLELRQCGQIAVYVSVLRVARSLDYDDDTASSPSGRGRRRRRIVGVFGIVDPVQAQAKSTVKALQNMGVDVWLCTGDHAVTARAVALQVGIDPDANVCASATPQGKEELVARLQQEGEEGEEDDVNVALHGNKGGYDYNKTATDNRGRRRVAVVGDGINDAVALARADVGIAIGAGTSVAVEAADVVLVRSSLHDVVVALHMSAVVYRRILLNFVWAMSYNLVAVPFAAGVMYPFTEFRLPPELAGLMMAFSSVSVVTSSLLLRNYKRPTIAEDDGTLMEEGGWEFLRNVVSCITCTGGNRTRRRQRQQQRRQQRRQRQQRRWRKQRSLSLSDGREAVYQGIPTKQVDIELI